MGASAVRRARPDRFALVRTPREEDRSVWVPPPVGPAPLSSEEEDAAVRGPGAVAGSPGRRQSKGALRCAVGLRVALTPGTGRSILERAARAGARGPSPRGCAPFGRLLRRD